MKQSTAEKAVATLIVVVTLLVLGAIWFWPDHQASSSLQGPTPVHFVGAGDIAGSPSGDTATSNEIIRLNPEWVFTLGDNTYPSGTMSQFQTYYNPTWGRRRTITWPTPGNHDYQTSGAAGYFAYFGVPSYYRVVIGGWSVYALNSNIARTATSAQVVWLKNQLAADPNACVMALFHHPRYSSGTNHGSNTSVQPFWDALAGRAELILNGHEHHYERFAPKGTIREIVVGTGGIGAGYPFGSPLAGSQKRISGKLGVLDLALTPTGYSARFMSTTNTVLDSFSGTC